MLLTISTTHEPATDLGYLLAKNPGRLQTFNLPYGRAQVFYPVAGPEICTAALYVEIDSVSLARRRDRSGYASGWLGEYINDRPYAASSFLSVAIARVFGSALAGTSRERPELATTVIPLQATITALPCRGGEDLLKKLFEPLGYEVEAECLVLDPRFPRWGDSRYFNVTLSGACRLSELLSHLYVLIPVLDDDKHYWVGEDEVEKLVRKGEGWLNAHPERQLIAQRYLRHRRQLYQLALMRLAEDQALPDEEENEQEAPEEQIERPIGLHEQRLAAVLGALKSAGAKSVLDLGCGEGELLRLLIEDRAFSRILGMDVSTRSLQRAADRLELDRLPARGRLELIQGSLTYRDKRLNGFDAAAVVEVIEHLDPTRLAAFEKVVFACARPQSVVITTPNVEYNSRFEGLTEGRLRHPDHRFEWRRAEFASWATAVADAHGYAVSFSGVGPEDDEVGPPTQMAIFRR
jgi:3' terminal RNA ribose 2'-O-methyltransferase Hen1